MNSDNDSDLYGDDIRLWSERQGALLRRLANGEAVFDRGKPKRLGKGRGAGLASGRRGGASKKSRAASLTGVLGRRYTSSLAASPICPRLARDQSPHLARWYPALWAAVWQT
jgi:hypothetical protein